ncbi:YraN family protein [Biostraticola tofi]|uniref:UPF0102 protein EDC52_102114 n=1 Tax=Biostraticola tofi TaxID=466109 RepID=A0A4V2W589_9GAMM|nr:YraN family protein [Biostraticola tofi]TCV98794.1 putative endonuclease [Biostraticola tofi]
MAEIPTGPAGSGPVSSRERGAQMELRARHYLERAGLRFIAANVTLRGGEIDVIMRDKQTWVFVEVRYRRNDAFGTAAQSVTIRKQQRLRLAAAVWLARHGSSLDTCACRFDVLAITGHQVEWLRNAFGS